MYVAVLRRFRAREERLAEYVRAGGTDQLARVTVDLDELDTVRHLEGRARAPQSWMQRENWEFETHTISCCLSRKFSAIIARTPPGPHSVAVMTAQ